MSQPRVTLKINLPADLVTRLEEHLEAARRREDPGDAVGMGLPPNRDDIIERALRAWFLLDARRRCGICGHNATVRTADGPRCLEHLEAEPEVH